MTNPKRDARPDGLYDAGKILAEHNRKTVLHHALQSAAGDREVEAVDRGGVDADQDLARPRRGYGQVVQGWRGPEVGNGDSAHGAPRIR